jgi:nicotinamidase-related amidase
MELAFFDTCSRHPDETNSHFVLAEKMKPIRKRIGRILRAAEKLGAPVLSTTCLGTLRCSDGMCARSTCAALAGAGSAASGEKNGKPAFVAMNATPAEVAEALRRREIVLERTSCKTGDENVRLRTFDAFGVNKNTAPIVRSFGDRHWLVFGAGFEHCLVAAVEGLRALGLRVTVLEDGCIHGGRSIPQTFLQTFDRIKALGAGWSTFEAVCNEHGLDSSFWREPARPAPVPMLKIPVGALAAAIETS